MKPCTLTCMHHKYTYKKPLSVFAAILCEEGGCCQSEPGENCSFPIGCHACFLLVTPGSSFFSSRPFCCCLAFLRTEHCPKMAAPCLVCPPPLSLYLFLSLEGGDTFTSLMELCHWPLRRRDEADLREELSGFQWIRGDILRTQVLKRLPARQEWSCQATQTHLQKAREFLSNINHKPECC